MAAAVIELDASVSPKPQAIQIENLLLSLVKMKRDVERMARELEHMVTAAEKLAEWDEVTS